jgi:replicative DNA helicase
VYTELKPDDFYHPIHRQLYASMLTLTQESQPVDLHTLADRLNAQKQLDAVGGLVFLAELADYEATAANVVHHARIVRDKAVKRRLIATATEIVELGFEEGDRADTLLDQPSRASSRSRARTRARRSARSPPRCSAPSTTSTRSWAAAASSPACRPASRSSTRRPAVCSAAT